MSRVRGVVAKSPAWAGVAVELCTVMLPTAGAQDPALLLSGGKDSVVLPTLAIKAFQIPSRTLQLPFTLLHVYTGHNYPEVIAFRDETVARTDVYLVVGHVEDSLKKARLYCAATVSERSATRMDDQVSETAMEKRKKAGYFISRQNLRTRQTSITQ